MSLRVHHVRGGDRSNPCGHLSLHRLPTLSGSAYRTTVPVAAEQFTMNGTPTLYTKTAENGNRRFQAFCPTCGSPIYSSAAEERPAVYNIRVGTVRQRSQLVPSVQIWCRSAQPWVNDLSNIPQVETDD